MCSLDNSKEGRDGGGGTKLITVHIMSCYETPSMGSQTHCLPLYSSHGYLTCVVVGLEMVWTAHSRSSRIQLWDIEDGRFRGSLPCDVIMNSM